MNQPRTTSRMLSDTDLDSIKAANPILPLVEQHVTLKKSGRSYKGLCPFHTERTPSFYVNPDVGTFKCFGCDAGGDVIDFVRRIEGGDSFRFAAQFLADRAGITIQGISDQDAEERSIRARVLEANEAASLFFNTELFTSAEAETARAFLVERNFDPDHATQFGCGYAPRSGTALVSFLTDNGFTPEEIETAGLARRTHQGSLRDFFQGRLLWTIRSEFDKALGFGARRIYDNDRIEAKFINTPETPVYKKTEVLYGYNLARKHIVKEGHAYIVEGYADVMACHAAGVNTAVASCGTSFTKDHLRTLRRSVGEAGELTFGLDDDNAGRKASLAVYDMAHSTVRRLTTLGTLGGKDPEEVRRNHGDAALARLVTQRTPLIQSVILATLTDVPLDSPEDKVVAIGQVAPLLGHVTDPLVQSEYATKVAQRIGVAQADVLSRIPGSSIRQGDLLEEAAAATRVPLAVRVEQDVLRVLAQDKAAAQTYYKVCADLFRTSAGKQIAQGIGVALQAPSALAWFEKVSVEVSDVARPMLFGLVTEGLPVDPKRLPDYAAQVVARLREANEAQAATMLRSRIEQTQDTAEKDAALAALINQAKGS